MRSAPWLRGRITADKKRLEVVKRRSADGKQCQVTFATKPDRAILDALRNAAFHFSGGSWFGKTEHLPPIVTS